jgi:hypothetical protein
MPDGKPGKPTWLTNSTASSTSSTSPQRAEPETSLAILQTSFAKIQVDFGFEFL